MDESELRERLGIRAPEIAKHRGFRCPACKKARSRMRGALCDACQKREDEHKFYKKVRETMTEKEKAFERKINAMRRGAVGGRIRDQLKIRRLKRKGVLPPDEPEPWTDGQPDEVKLPGDALLFPPKRWEDRQAEHEIECLPGTDLSSIKSPAFLPAAGDVRLTRSGMLVYTLEEERDLVDAQAQIQKYETMKWRLNKRKEFEKEKEKGGEKYNPLRGLQFHLKAAYTELDRLRPMREALITTLRDRDRIETDLLNGWDSQNCGDPIWCCPRCWKPLHSLRHACLHLRYRHLLQDDEILKLIKEDLIERRLLPLCEEREEAVRRKKPCAEVKGKIVDIVGFASPVMATLPYDDLLKIFKKFPRWTCPFCKPVSYTDRDGQSKVSQPFNTERWDRAEDHLVEQHEHELSDKQPGCERKDLPELAHQRVAAWFDEELQKAIERIRPKEPAAKRTGADDEWIFTEDMEKFKKALGIPLK